MRAFHLAGTSEAARKPIGQSLLSPCYASRISEIPKGWNFGVALIHVEAVGSREADKVSSASSVLHIHRIDTGIPLFTFSVLRSRTFWANASPELGEFRDDKAIDNADMDYWKTAESVYRHERNDNLVMNERSGYAART
ncbi:MAG: hypothetical protein J6575_06475 [Bifidobacterium sp.]|nr:hypothetical protein [Bifidobacterium sp.]